MHNSPEYPHLLDQMTEVLTQNDRGEYTQPGHGLYPHQWLWDSCFIAIGLAHIDIDRAQTELTSLLRGQWHNGMLPNIIFRPEPKYRTDRMIWRSWINPNAPSDVATTGITQPPMFAEAIVQIGEKLDWPERRIWYARVWPALLRYHEWLYTERDPHHEGLTLQIHPWETGLDNSPPWMNEMHDHLMPLWIRLLEKSKLDRIIGLFRRDTKSVPSDERFSTIEAITLFDAQLRLRRKGYDINKILDHGLFAIEDLSFNSILIRANHHLRAIAHSLKQDVPEELDEQMQRTEKVFDQLWDDYSGQYYSRDFITHRLLKIPTVATLLPLYAGHISKTRAAQLVRLLEQEHGFGPAYAVPSVPIDSPWFRSKLYWQGPTWVNMNWLIIEGLKRYGYDEHAAVLTESTLEMVARSGASEYFDPLTGDGIGADGFSWTAALTIDLLKHQ